MPTFFSPRIKAANTTGVGYLKRSKNHSLSEKYENTYLECQPMEQLGRNPPVTGHSFCDIKGE